MLKFLKTYALFISMALGIILNGIFAPLSPISKYLLFLMLLVTYCRISPRELKLERLHLWLACFQIFGSMAIYLALKPFNIDLAQGVLICIIIPTAISAPVITVLLGGSISCLASYSITSNLAISVIAPLFFSIVGVHNVSNEEMTFWQSFSSICLKVIPLLIGPFIVAMLLKILTPKFHEKMKSNQIISFWLWAFALMVLMGKTTNDIIHMDSSNYHKAAIVALGSAAICCIQFGLGRFIGRKYGNTIAGGQALGQKNTILAIWMAQTFFNPIVAIAPASYVLWQNLINSFQLWKHNKKAGKEVAN